MQETLHGLEVIGKYGGGGLLGGFLSILIIFAYLKRLGVLDLFKDEKKAAAEEHTCLDPVCQANILFRAERQADLEEHVYEVLTPKLNEIAEGVAYIKGKLEK